ncbi:sugar ABC transporter substrate-binding protein [uncultured Meiothermus sp.]|jgi:multiple sugar transport system substrate-binding protein|uniref:ABC transporter substrate-binding protein n=1 Tax=uncultured Meiothermus sp. TaxID=157471 RepID=UPI002615428E|nr:sugar ABC transporter substrate-binding protein [uncultured Meiothermus sp.]
MKRKLVLGIAALMVGSLGLAQNFNWEQARGSQIRVLLNQHPWTTAITPFLPEFERLSGVKVVVETFPEAQFRNKVLVELASGTGALDAFMLTPNQEGNLYLRSGWLEPLSSYVGNPALTAPGFDQADFFPASIRAASIGGSLVGLPIQQETTMLFYRKDLFQKYNIPVPRTFAELEAAAKALHNKDGVAGIGLRGRGAAATSQLAPYLFGHGGDWLSANRRSRFFDAEWVNALTFYSGLLRNYGPAGSTTMSWPEITSLFAQGKLAMFTDGSLFKSILDDPRTSTVADKVGYAAFPAGPTGRRTPVAITWALSMSKASKNKVATWLFMQWATNKQNQLRVLLADVPASRRSAWNSAEYKARDKTPEWSAINLEQLEYANPVWNPPVVAVGEVRDILGRAIVTAINGGNVRDALTRAATQTNTVLDRER